MMKRGKFNLTILIVIVTVSLYGIKNYIGGRVSRIEKINGMPYYSNIFDDTNYCLAENILFYESSINLYVKFDSDEKTFDELVNKFSLNGSARKVDFSKRISPSREKGVNPLFLPEGVRGEFFEESPSLRLVRSKSSFYFESKSSEFGVIYIHWIIEK